MSGTVPHFPGEHKVEFTLKRIVREGEVIDHVHRNGEPGPGIRIDGEEWVAGTPGAGFLEIDDTGRASVAPVAFLTADRLKGLLDFRHPQEGEAALTREEVDIAVASLEIAHGFNQSRIDAAWRVFEARGVLMRSMRFASGTAPVHLKPSHIEYERRFRKERAQAKSQGAMDHRDRGGVLNIEQGETIGIWHQGEEPMPGMGVDGVVIEVKGSGGSLGKLTIGSNIELVEDEYGISVLKSTVCGVLTVIKGTPHVSEVMTITGDVDYDSGNVDAGGSVLVKGSVRPGFSVSAKHSLTVMGVVEGASLSSGGDMELKKGLIGAEGVSVQVGGNLILKYAQNADITCRGDVELLDADMGSTIYSSGAITAMTGRGRLRGGDYCAMDSISAKEIGSDLGALTKLRCGTDLPGEREKQELTDQLNGLNHKLQKLKRKPDGGGPAAQQKQAKKKRELQKAQRPLLARLTELSNESAKRDASGTEDTPYAPSIVATSRVYFGTEIEFSRSRLRPAETTGGRRFLLDPETRTITAEQL